MPAPSWAANITNYPSIVIVTMMGTVTVLDDSAGAVTAQQVADAVAAATAAEAAYDQAIATSQAGLQGLYANRAAMQTAISDDATLIANAAAAITAAGSWDALTAAQRTQIANDVLAVLGRILKTGMADTMQAHMDHLIVAGIVSPS
jgi:hypothetical protein